MQAMTEHMLFNSFGFITLFLPITLIGFFLIGRHSSAFARFWLIGCSLVFYGWWSIPYLGLLLIWIAVDFCLGRWITNIRDVSARRTRQVLIFGVTLNVLALAFFKYRIFIADNVTALSGIEFTMQALVLPLAISFHTFQQIAYLVDATKPETPRYTFPQYLLFVSYFPQLIAGPIVHHSELLPQFGRREIYRFSRPAFSAGVFYFAIGLAKKVLIADPLGAISDPVFTVGASEPDFFDAWTATLAFGLGLYFDFSGYSDMAVGLARMIGIRLPLNFASPYKAKSIIEFWRNWHMTLSRWLRDYVYIPLGGNRHGGGRRFTNLFITMLIGGLWHGAAFTFVIWGALHGIYLMINHGWIRLKSHFDRRGIRIFLPTLAGQGLTLFSVMMAWVFFASPSLNIAAGVFSGLVGANGFGSDNLWLLAHSLMGDSWARQVVGPFGSATLIVSKYTWLLVAAIIAISAPNSQQIVESFSTGPESGKTEKVLRRHWRKSAVAAGVVCTVAYFSLGELKQFIYFQF